MSVNEINPSPFERDICGYYKLKPSIECIHRDDIIGTAMTLLGRRFLNTIVLDTPQRVRDFFMARLEQFGDWVLDVVFLDKEFHVLDYRRVSFVTLEQPYHYKRLVVQWALELNASQMVLAQNYFPDGSDALDNLYSERKACWKLKQLLAELDIKIFDYLCVQGRASLSFAENGYLSKEYQEDDELLYEYEESLAL
jgi:DNA repair protein RadC